MSKTREKLIDAAITYLNTEGKEKISVKKLIKIADVGYGTFYNHFDSVEAIQYEALNKTVRNTLIDFKLGVKNEKDYVTSSIWHCSEASTYWSIHLQSIGSWKMYKWLFKFSKKPLSPTWKIIF